MRFRICPDRIFGRGGSIPFEILGGEGEEWGEGYSAEDMARARRMGGKYRRGGGIKRAQDVVPHRCLMHTNLLGNTIPGLDQLITAVNHTHLDNAMNRFLSNTPYTVKL